MFEAARTGNGELLLAAIDAGLPVNLMNHKGKIKDDEIVRDRLTD
jgi:hypothetical protein